MRTDEEMKEIYHLYGDSVFKLALAYVKDYDTAQDIMQNVFIKYLLTSKHFRDKEHEKAWLLRVTKNECKMHIRLVWNSRRTSIDEITDKTYEAADADGVIDRVLALPLPYRMVIHLYYYEGYSVNEIAAIVGKKPGTVTSLMCRARKMLKEDLTDEV